MKEEKITNQKSYSRDSIIGLGETSFRKNYYPELQKKIRDLEKINARNEAIISAIPDVMLVCDLEGNITPFIDLSGRKDNLLSMIIENKNIMHILQDSIQGMEDSQSFLVKEMEMVSGKEIVYMESRFQRSESQEILIMIRDMTERIRMEQRLLNLAERDNLTNLYNRRSFEEILNRYNGREVNNIAVLSIDINGLKFTNDTLGHLAGDKMIVDSAKLIYSIFCEVGHVSRIGGDEFAVVLENIAEYKVIEMLSLLSLEVEQYNLTSQIISLSIAYGYSHHKDGLADMEYMFQLADNQMYENKLQNKENSRRMQIDKFMKALEEKDYIATGHISRMAESAALIGLRAKLRIDQLNHLSYLIKYHDIGKVGISDHILMKPTKLNKEEWVVMKTHSAIGERIAMELPELKEIAPLILHHHEKWDGSGYPSGLKNEEIPIECRIMAIVESFDAMTNERPFHKIKSEDEAIHEIISFKGIYYDPELVDIFVRIKQID